MDRHDLRIGALLALCLGQLACSDGGEDSSSPMTDSGTLMRGEDAAIECEPAGDYQGTLTMLSGNCGAQPPLALTIPESAFVTHTEMRADVDVVTTTVLDGCTVRLTRETRSRGGVLVLRLNASDLRLVSEGVLEGQAQLTRFQDNAVICEGVYEMTLHATP